MAPTQEHVQAFLNGKKNVICIILKNQSQANFKNAQERKTSCR